MTKYSKIIVFLFIFSLIVSLAIYLLMGGESSYIEISIIIFTSIYAGSFGAVLFVSKKFRKLSSEQIGFWFFAILFTVSLFIFAGISYYLGKTVKIYFKDGVTHEEAQRAYFYFGISTFMPIKMFIGTFIGMLLAIQTTNIKSKTNAVELNK